MLGFLRIDVGVVLHESDLLLGLRTARDVDDDGEDDWGKLDLELTENGPYRHVSSQCFSLG